jgi:hypothetical protein
MRRYRRLSRNQKLIGSAVAAGLAAALIHGHTAVPVAPAAPATAGPNEALANQMAAAAPYRWAGGQARCLDQLWTKESGFRAAAVNGQTGATGIPQLNPNYYPVPAGWAAPAVQIRWGLAYIARTYGTPCGAWTHEEASNWY